ncbi:MAG: ABC transporter permease subunit [Clostridia bacterium]|nr:ABC transporter permease subunit [Clostridia bacterium]
MTLSTIRNKPKKKWIAPILTLGAVLFWIGIWWLAAEQIDKAWVLPTPAQVFKALFSTITVKKALPILLSSLWGIFKGYLWGGGLGLLLAALTARIYPLHLLFSPLLTVVKATPIASFILILWVFFTNSAVPAYAVMLIVLPIIWANTEAGFGNTDEKLSEMARAYDLSLIKRIWYLYIPSAYPFFKSAAVTALGMAWKAGIAAEVFCTPDGTVGKMIAHAKRDIETAELFAWTILVVAVCFLFEKLLAALLSLPERKGRVKK